MPQRNSTTYSDTETEDQLNHVGRRRAEGASLRQIRLELDPQYPGIGLATVQRREDEWLRRHEPHPDAQRYRAEQMIEMRSSRMKLRQAMAAWAPVQRNPILDDAGNPVLGLDGKPTFVASPGDVDSLCKLVNAFAKLHASEARLLGLDQLPLPSEAHDRMSDGDLMLEVVEWMGSHPELTAEMRDQIMASLQIDDAGEEE